MSELASHFDELTQDFTRDAAKESGGTWMTYRRHKYLVARAHRNNKAFLREMEEGMRPFQWAIDRNDLGAMKNAATGVLQEVYAKSILKGIKKLDGTDLPYTAQDGMELFKKLPDLWDTIFKFSNSESNYTPDQVADDSKN